MATTHEKKQIQIGVHVVWLYRTRRVRRGEIIKRRRTYGCYRSTGTVGGLEKKGAVLWNRRTVQVRGQRLKVYLPSCWRIDNILRAKGELA